MTEVEFKQKYEMERGASFPGYYYMDEVKFIEELFLNYPVKTIKYGLAETEQWVKLKNPKAELNGVIVPYAFNDAVKRFMTRTYSYGNWFATLEVLDHGTTTRTICLGNGNATTPTKRPTDEPLPKLPPPQLRRSYMDVAPDITAETMHKVTTQNDFMKWKLFVLLRHIQSGAMNGDTRYPLHGCSIDTIIDDDVRAFFLQHYNMPGDAKEVLTVFSDGDIETLIPHLEQRGFIIKKDEATQMRYVTW